MLILYLQTMPVVSQNGNGKVIFRHSWHTTYLNSGGNDLKPIGVPNLQRLEAQQLLWPKCDAELFSGDTVV